MKVFIPTIGQPIRLCENWEFLFYYERRNMNFLLSLKENGGNSCWPELRLRRGVTMEEFAAASAWRKVDYLYDDCGDQYRPERMKHEIVTLEALTVMTVCRVYIRGNTKDARNFDSLTFTIKRGGMPSYPKVYGRFWANLKDVNNLDVELGTITT